MRDSFPTSLTGDCANLSGSRPVESTLFKVFCSISGGRKNWRITPLFGNLTLSASTSLSLSIVSFPSLEATFKKIIADYNNLV